MVDEVKTYLLQRAFSEPRICRKMEELRAEGAPRASSVNDLTMQTLADAAGLNRDTISHWVRGKITLRDEACDAIAKALWAAGPPQYN